MTITFIATGGWIRFDRHLEDASAKDYDVVIIPGGVWNRRGAGRLAMTLADRTGDSSLLLRIEPVSWQITHIRDDLLVAA